GPVGHRAPRHPGGAPRHSLGYRPDVSEMEAGVMTTEDPLLAALIDARERKQRADHDIRLLLAYAREHVQPRPYRLADLARAAGMSIAGVPPAYPEADMERAARLPGGPRSGPLGAVIVSLLTSGRSPREHPPAA